MASSTSGSLLPPAKSPNVGNNLQLGLLADCFLENPTNPLLINVVLDVLFGTLDFHTLSQCRRVCKLWQKLSLPHWRQAAPALSFRLFDDGDDDGCYENDDCYGEMWDKRDVSEFLELAHNAFRTYSSYDSAGLRQYRKFEIRGSASFGPSRQILQRFLVNAGEWITELKLIIVFPDLETFRGVLYSKFTPNLVTLRVGELFSVKFKHHDDEKEEDGEEHLEGGGGGGHKNLRMLEIEGPIYCPTKILSVEGWMHLLKHYPNLKTLILTQKNLLMPEGLTSSNLPEKFTNPRVTTRTEQEIILTAIRNVREEDPNNVLQLTRLEVYNTSGGDVSKSLQALLQKNLLPALETFGIAFGRSTSNEQSCEILEKLQASTVKRLTINKEEDPLQNFQPPELQLVEHLQLDRCPFHRLTFLKSFPNLKVLDIRAHGLVLSVKEEHLPLFSGIKVEELGGLVLPSLTRFNCVYGKQLGVFTAKDILKLRKCMPNLSELGLWMTNQTFRVACRCWPNLKRLHIVGNQVDDEGITGAVANRRRNLQDNITSFQELEFLKMGYLHEDYDYDELDAPAAITPKSVFDGFLKLSKLKKVEITVPSWEMLKLLKSAAEGAKEIIPDFKITPSRIIRTCEDSIVDESF